jgi:Zn-dependent protease
MRAYLPAMRWSFSIGRLLGFPVELHLTFVALLVLAVVFGGPQMAGLFVLAFASVLAHELGHAVVARRLGMPILGITLYPFGGMARMAGQPTPKDELLIAAAGPAVSIILACFAAMAWVLTGSWLLGVLASINMILGVFNLIPALPMDGGRILRAWLAARHGPLRATLTAGRIARFIAVGLAFSAFWLGPMVLVISVLVWWMAGQEMAVARARAWAATRDPLGGHDPFSPMRGPAPPRVPASRVVVVVPPTKG